uniref:Uncharacterized protein n=1 Tax=Anguilla anguilla TaxID=7936 RepID=A0A0E9RB68_ANGAN
MKGCFGSWAIFWPLLKTLL